MKAPVFVVAPVRSGSTLLRLMLDAHPKITNPGECDFLFDRVGDLGSFPDIEQYCEWLSANRIFLQKNIKANSSLEYEELMGSLIQQLRGDTTESLVMNVHRHFQRIPKVFPGARYIHLLRDPRDVARSCIGMGWAGHVYFGVDVWTEAELSWDRLKTSLRPEQYLEVRYEELLEDPENILGDICGFLGVEYSAGMLDYPLHSSYSKPDKRLCYQWKRKYSERELQLVEGKVKDLLIDRGYELSGIPPAVPGLFELWRLKLANRIYRTRFAINRYGLRLYVEHQLARRLNRKRWLAATQVRKNEVDERYLK